MLKEMKHVRQIHGDGFRRWFTDEYFDLFVWFEDKHYKKMTGFQLCYDKVKNEHAITWTENKGFVHETVDDGESNASVNRTPILVSDGIFDYQTTAERFKKNSGDIDKDISDFVYKKILDYHA